MPFYTDLGEEYPLKVDGEIVVDRYAYWEIAPFKGKHQVHKTGNDLEKLMKEFGEEQVVNVLTRREENEQTD